MHDAAEKLISLHEIQNRSSKKDLISLIGVSFPRSNWHFSHFFSKPGVDTQPIDFTAILCIWYTRVYNAVIISKTTRIKHPSQKRGKKEEEQDTHMIREGVKGR